MGREGVVDGIGLGREGVVDGIGLGREENGVVITWRSES